jgi:hypothetical protein
MDRPSRKRVTRRNDAPRKRSLFRRGPLRGIATQVVIVFGCVWLLGFLGCLAWYLKTHNRGWSSSSVVGVQSAAARKVGYLGQQPHWGREKQEKEEKTEAPGPQTGVKHIPNLLPFSTDSDAYRSPLLIFTCKRPEYLSQTLDDILENIGDHCAFGCPVVVSEDGASS